MSNYVFLLFSVYFFKDYIYVSVHFSPFVGSTIFNYQLRWIFPRSAIIFYPGMKAKRWAQSVSYGRTWGLKWLLLSRASLRGRRSIFCCCLRAIRQRWAFVLSRFLPTWFPYAGNGTPRRPQRSLLTLSPRRTVVPPATTRATWWTHLMRPWWVAVWCTIRWCSSISNSNNSISLPVVATPIGAVQVVAPR